MNRNEVFEGLRAQPDVMVLIVGGGINGAGLFRDLALQGVDVLLVERGDFCSGASASPSRMIHGGLRYLENGEFRLVRESLKERDLLLKNAPHYVRPLPATVPIYSYFDGIVNAGLRFLGLSQKATQRGALVVKIGLSLYDRFTQGRHAMPAHRFESREESLEEHHGLSPHIVCTATYYDAWIPYPERLCLEVLLDGETAHPGAQALNYVSATAADGAGVTLRDELSGASVQVHPQVVVNAGGAWIDMVNQKIAENTRFIGGTKGSHLIIDNDALYRATAGKMMYYENADGRICILFPLLDKVLVGSTDIRIDNPDEARTTDTDIDYMLDSVRQVFPEIDVDRDDIVFHFVGVRPLPSSESSTTGQISRDHSIRELPPDGNRTYPVYSLVGGKWTTFRAFAEQAADVVLRKLGKARRTTTEDLKIGGGQHYPANPARWAGALADKYGLSTERADTLLARYGTRAADVARALGDDRPLEHLPSYSAEEILWMVEHERVQQLDDLLLRRTTIALQGQASLPLLDELAELLAPTLGWSLREAKRQTERTADLLRNRHGVTLPLPHPEGVPL